MSWDELDQIQKNASDETLWEIVGIYREQLLSILQRCPEYGPWVEQALTLSVVGESLGVQGSPPLSDVCATIEK